jgi:protein SCO1/2
VNKKALYAVMLAALLPLISYFIVKRYSETAVQMPRHYFADSVNTITKNGKRVSDTVWHTLSDISLVNQAGDSVSLSKLKGKILIADFFFTHCPSICPAMTSNMKRLQESIHNGQRVGDRTNKKVHFLSISIDPERDSVERLKFWADRFQIDPEQWWLLSGDKKTIYDFAINEIKLGTVDGRGIDTSFIHSEKFVLIDSNRHVRGYYNGLDSSSLADLSNDLILLTMEKDPNRKSFLAGKLQLLAVVVLVAIIGVGLFLFIFKRKKTNVATGLEKE